MTSFEYDEFVVVAEEELKIHRDKNANSQTRFSTPIGNYEWYCSFITTTYITNNSVISLELECHEIIDGIVKEMHIEVIVHSLEKDSNFNGYKYCRLKHERKLLNGTSSKWSYTDPKFNNCENVLLTIRILKDRSQCPRFNAPNLFGIFSSDVKLRIGEQNYHVNKQLLSWLSPYFDRMFNDENYKESKQEEIELKLEDLSLTNPKVFEDFLLLYQGALLPNSQNVGDLLVLAEYFQMDVLKKCERHLELCREMDISERVLLAKKFELKELQTKLVKQCTLEEAKRICIALLNAF